MKMTDKHIDKPSTSIDSVNCTYKNNIYVKWGEVPFMYVSHDEFNEVHRYLIDNKFIKRKYKTVYTNEPSYYVEITKEGVVATYYILHYKEYPAVKIINECQELSSKQCHTVSGMKALEFVDDLFNEKNGISMRAAFGFADNKALHDRFFYTALIATDKNFLNTVYDHVCKADVHSAYPYQLTKPLPDAHTVRLVEGFVEPTEEYPFAFYSDNQIAIYNELDTHDWLNHRLNTLNIDDKWIRKYGYDNRFHYKEPIKKETLLCKASKYSLKSTMDELYELKRTSTGQQKEYYKQILVSFIGAMSSKNFKISNCAPRMHLCAVTYARHMIEMMKYYDRIVGNGGVFLSIATDSIIWIGKNNVAESSSELGAFNIENENAKCLIISQGVYALQQGNMLTTVKHQGYDSNKIEMSRFRSIEDLRIYEFKERLHRNEDGTVTKGVSK